MNPSISWFNCVSIAHTKVVLSSRSKLGLLYSLIVLERMLADQQQIIAKQQRRDEEICVEQRHQARV